MKFGDLRATLRYVPLFQGCTFVVSLDGAVIASEHFSNILIDLELLRSLGVKIVLVYDATHQIEQLGKDRGVEIPHRPGFGPTDESVLQLAEDAVSQLTGKLRKDLAAVGLRAAAADVLTVRPAGIVGGVDQLFRGKVREVDLPSLEALLNQTLLPLVSPIGYDSKGNAFCLTGELVAAEIGMALGAAKVLFVCQNDLSQVFARRLPQLSVSEAVWFLEGGEAGKFPENLVEMLSQAMRVCGQGVARAHLVPGMQEETLLAELFSNEGVGVMIYADTYKTIRQAEKSDVDAIFAMTRHAVEEEQLVARSREEIHGSLADIWVLEMDDNLVGCASLKIYETEKVAEVAGLFIAKSHAGQGHGQSLITHLLEQAKKRGCKQIIAFSTQAPDFFLEKCAFTEPEDLEIVPQERREAYESSARNSRLFVREL